MTRPFGFCLTFQKDSVTLNIWFSSATDMAWEHIEVVKKTEESFIAMEWGYRSGLGACRQRGVTCGFFETWPWKSGATFRTSC